MPSEPVSTTIQIRFLVDDDQAKAEIHEALSQAGVGLTPWDDLEAADQDVIVVFDKSSPAVHEQIRTMTDGRICRVAAVAAPGSRLSVPDHWRLVEAGAAEAFAWDHSQSAPAEIAARLRRWQRIDELVHSPLVRDNIVGESPAWVAALRKATEIGRCATGPVLLTGETGTGKEMIARLIHGLDARPGKRELIILDCATVVPTLAGSEFFGHQRGSFTGATSARKGAFALADHGTLFLDEIQELPIELQGELLRVIQEGSYKPIGSDRWAKTSFRLICASQKRLGEEVAADRFRRDLYHRIAVLSCHLPPLRERRQDVLPLARHFLQAHFPADPPALDPPVREYLEQRSYPGNVRDLKQLIARICARHVGPGPITVGDLPHDERPVTLGATKPAALPRLRAAPALSGSSS